MINTLTGIGGFPPSSVLRRVGEGGRGGSGAGGCGLGCGGVTLPPTGANLVDVVFVGSSFFELTAGGATGGCESTAMPRVIFCPHLPQKAVVFLTAAPQCGQGSSSATAATVAGATISRATGRVGKVSG